jgi:hypothetical protein
MAWGEIPIVTDVVLRVHSASEIRGGSLTLFCRLAKKTAACILQCKPRSPLQLA